MDAILRMGLMFLLKLAETSTTEMLRQREQAHQQRLNEQLLRERARIMARQAARREELRAQIDRAKLAVVDPRWQQRVDLLVARMKSP
ncbi:hypothetical protein WMF31_37515 [Sorangium sp. So ce1036]|uniref:hypothetical protein n=1 Tax=Sorangium sp. So ce1036 TaxID=3133328 RepID=UPI003F08BD1C